MAKIGEKKLSDLEKQAKKKVQSKVVCQECGQQLSSWAERHTYEDCGKYHLKRAKEILNIDFEVAEKLQKRIADAQRYKIRYEKEINNYREAELENPKRLKNKWFVAWRNSLLFINELFEKVLAGDEKQKC